MYIYVCLAYKIIIIYIVIMVKLYFLKIGIKW